MSREENSPQVYQEIDENLRKAYEEMLNEDLPYRFMVLIEQLREKNPALKPTVFDGESL